MENTNDKKATAPGLSPEWLREGGVPVRKAQVARTAVTGGGIFPLEPSASCCEGEKLHKPQDRLWSMGLASRVTLCVCVGEGAGFFSPLLFWDPALRPGAFGVAHVNSTLSPDLIWQRRRWRSAVGARVGETGA